MKPETSSRILQKMETIKFDTEKHVAYIRKFSADAESFEYLVLVDVECDWSPFVNGRLFSFSKYSSGPLKRL